VNIPLQRLIDGIIATLRGDVIPHVENSYARGQAVGVIDLLLNIAPRVEWARAPLLLLVEEKRVLLDALSSLLPESVGRVPMEPVPDTVDGLLEVKGRLDAAIGDAITVIWPRRREPGFDRAAELVQAHLHDEIAAEMKRTRKPLFAEIASGSDTANNTR
jgi:hypothetical protein